MRLIKEVPGVKNKIKEGKITLSNLSKALPVKTKAQVWHLAKGKCQFVDKQTGRFCRESRGLEIDHIKPLILGGSDQVENLRLFCQGTIKC